MVLLDTSVWIRHWRAVEPYRTHVDRLLETQQVLAHEFVYGELLVGDPGARAKPLQDYSRFEYAATVPHREVVQLVRARRLHGRGIGWIDAHLLASTLGTRAALYTADKLLRELAEELGVDYRA